MLRGIAALGVSWFHFTNGNPDFLPRGYLKSSGSFGWLGVEVFFVISGFIIPFALHRSEYLVSDFGKFLLKRIIRLDPPYLVAIIITIVLGYFSTLIPGFKGPPFKLSAVDVALHLGYMNVFFGHPWLNPVFWTLGIEMQYYLLIGFLFFVVAHRLVMLRACAFFCMAGFSLFISADQFIFHWLFLFMLGMAAFQLRAELQGRKQFILWVVFLGSGTYYVNGALEAIVGVITALLLELFEVDVRNPLLFFGQISYSLYLLHVPVGGRIVNLGQRFVFSFPGKIGVLAIALGASIAAAWLLYKFVELPAQQWSSKIRYRRRTSALSSPTAQSPVTVESARVSSG